MANEEAVEKEIQAKGLTAPRLTPGEIDATILAEFYVTGSQILASGPERGPGDAPLGATSETAMRCLTICTLVLRNGFTVVGKSACASPENFDAELGRRIARDDARRQIWALEGYALRNRLAGF